MATKAKYTDDDRARVFLALSVHQGNVKRTARETQIPVSTIRSWKADWEKNPPSTEVAVRIEEQAGQFVNDAIRIRDKALLAFEQKVESGDITAAQLMTGVGILTDKINIATGLAKKETPAQSTAAEIEFARQAAKELVGALTSSREREIVVDATEAEWRQADKAPPEPEEAS